MNILEAIQDPELFEGDFAAESWAPWLTLLRTLFGLPMSEADLALFKQCTGRTAPSPDGYTEAWLICGRRGGKSKVLAALAVWISCFKDWRPHLSRGEVGVVAVIARDREQAKVIFNYIRGMLDPPILFDQVLNMTRRSIELRHSVVVEVHTSDYRSVRGRTIVAALCDEIAYWKSEDSATPDVELLNAIRPAMGTVPGSMLLCASSPFARHGALHQAYQDYHGVDDAAPLTWLAPTRVMNPSYPQAKIDAEMRRDEARARAEFLCEFRGDLEGFVKLDVVQGCLGSYETRPPIDGITYRAFVDPSGGGPDSFVCAIAHRERDSIHVDCYYERSGAKYSPNAAVEEIAQLVRRYRIHEVVGDRFGSELNRELFGRHGLRYRTASKDRTELYKGLLPLLNSGTITLPRSDALVQQLVSLQRRVAASGRELIDHAKGRHDDIANAVAGAADLCSEANRMPMAMFGRYGSPDPKPRSSKFDGPILEGPLAGGFATSSKVNLTRPPEEGGDT